MRSKTLNFLKASFIVCLGILISILVFGKLSKVRNFKDTQISNEKIIGPIVKTDSSKILRDSIVNYAMGLLGKPYIEAGCSMNGFDCSGFVYFVFQHYHVQVPRSSSEFQNFGKTISIDSVKKGDILVFLSPTRNEIGHVGIVTKPNGKETEFIHSSSGAEMEVIITSLKREGYTKRFVKAVNVLGKYEKKK